MLGVPTFSRVSAVILPEGNPLAVLPQLRSGLFGNRALRSGYSDVGGPRGIGVCIDLLFSSGKFRRFLVSASVAFGFFFSLSLVLVGFCWFGDPSFGCWGLGIAAAMEKEKPSGHGPGGGLPHPSARYAPLGGSASGGGFPVKPETSPCPSPATVELDSARFSHDISRMPEFPMRNPGHRRAHSEILGLPDDISFDHDLGVVGPADGPMLSDETEEDLFSMYIDTEKFGSSSEASESLALHGGESSDTAQAASWSAAGQSGYVGSSSNERPRVRHQHSQSMDGTSSFKPELLISGLDGSCLADAKKAVSTAKLADLALIDPKRAKRILANRQSAARSKERKMRYISELERKVQTLQTEATTLSAQLTVLQRDTNGLTAENNELKLRLQTMEQQVHLQDALNDALREEVQRLKLMTGQPMPNGSQMMNFGSSFGATPQFYSQNHAMQSLIAAQQLQQLQIHSQHQQQLHPNQHHHPQLQASHDVKAKAPMTSQNQNQIQRDHTLDNSNPPKEG